MKKVLTPLIVFALILSLLTGCAASGTPSGSTKDPSAETPKSAETAKSETIEETERPDSIGNKDVETPGAFDVIEAVPNRAYKIVVTQMNTNDTNAVTAIEGFKKAGEYYGVEIIAMDNKGDPVQAVSNLDTAITMDADYFISYTADAGACAQIAAKLKEKGMAGMGLQATLGDDFPFFRLDPAMSGEASGTPLAMAAKEKFGDDVPYLFVLGYPEAGPVIADRSAAAIEAVKAVYPDVEVVEYSSKADPETSRSGMQDILTAHPNGHFMFWGHHDQYTLAAYQAIKAADREDDCVVTSIVCTEGMCEELQREGTAVVGTCSIRPEVWGWMVLPQIIEYLNDGTKIPHDLYQPCQLVTKDNLGEIYPERVIG